MKFLLDTHTFIWNDDTPHMLSATVKSIIQDKQNTILLSYASIWEMQIKLQTGKMTFSLSLKQKIEDQQRNGLELLEIELSHLYALDALPFHHRDPFDRLLIAQAISEGIPILSHDPVFSAYPVRIVW